MHDAHSGDEAAYERIVHEGPEICGAVQQRVLRPETGPGNDREKQSRLETVEGKEKRQRHGRDCTGKTASKRERRPQGPPFEQS
jgi:hypothetical protein